MPWPKLLPVFLVRDHGAPVRNDIGDLPNQSSTGGRPLATLEVAEQFHHRMRETPLSPFSVSSSCR
jgi:hypothetical protein